MTKVTIENVKEHIGGIVHVDRDHICDDDVVEACRKALDDRGVLVFPQVHLTNELAGHGSKESLQSPLRTHRLEQSDLVVVAGPLYSRIAFVIDRQAKLASLALQDKQLLKIEQRIAEQCFASQRLQIVGEFR